jgi:anhydro-N-acetylmuramic acid kinase
VIAQRTGITTISNFRARDMAAGGQGAPLVPFVDYCLFADDIEGRAVQNIGGIANVTALPPGRNPERVLGPGNMILDALALALLGQAADWGGATAAELTAWSICEQYRHFVVPRMGWPKKVIVGGGGTHSLTPMRVLRENLPQTTVQTHEDYGISNDAKEAIAFAVLSRPFVAFLTGH